MSWSRTIVRGRDGSVRPAPERTLLPAFDSTTYSQVGQLIAATKQEDVSKVSKFYESAVAPHGGTGRASDESAIATRRFRDLKVACTWANWISIAPISDDVNNCIASLEGPLETPYEGGVFWLRVQFPPQYPFQPPNIRFLTKVYHPNISLEGQVCVDILAESWTPVLSISTVLASIHLLFSQPEWDSPLVPEIAKQHREDRIAFLTTASEWTDEYARQERPDLLAFDGL